MLKGFKNAAELDFTIDENKVKMEDSHWEKFQVHLDQKK